MDLNGIAAADRIAKQAQPQLSKLKSASEQVEAVFIKDLLTEMQKGVDKVEFGKSYGGEIYQDMLNQTIADSASKSGSFGIASVLYNQFSKEVMRQAAASATPAPQGQNVNVEG